MHSAPMIEYVKNSHTERQIQRSQQPCGIAKKESEGLGRRRADGKIGEQ
jgi:hypothetical protein